MNYLSLFNSCFTIFLFLPSLTHLHFQPGYIFLCFIYTTFWLCRCPRMLNMPPHLFLFQHILLKPSNLSPSKKDAFISPHTPLLPRLFLLLHCSHSLYPPALHLRAAPLSVESFPISLHPPGHPSPVPLPSLPLLHHFMILANPSPSSASVSSTLACWGGAPSVKCIRSSVSRTDSIMQSSAQSSVSEVIETGREVSGRPGTMSAYVPILTSWVSRLPGRREVIFTSKRSYAVQAY